MIEDTAVTKGSFSCLPSPTAVAQELLQMRKVRQEPGVDHSDREGRRDLLQRFESMDPNLIFAVRTEFEPCVTATYPTQV